MYWVWQCWWLALLALSGVAQSAMWVGAELGGNFQPSIGYDGHVPWGLAQYRQHRHKPSVIGGATIGYDFVNSGFGAYAWPDWMKYFSFAMDFTYNRLDIQDGRLWYRAIFRDQLQIEWL